MIITEKEYLEAVAIAKKYLLQIEKEVDLMAQTNDGYFAKLEEYFSPRAIYCIKANCSALNINYKSLKLSDISRFPIEDLMKYRNVGRESLSQLIYELDKRGFKLKHRNEQ